jgi:hypothetical protein
MEALCQGGEYESGECMLEGEGKICQIGTPIGGDPMIVRGKLVWLFILCEDLATCQRSLIC